MDVTHRTPSPVQPQAERSLATPQADRAQASPAEADTKTSGWGGTLLAVIGVVVSLVYLANPGWGAIELLPDYLPGVGNLDEFLFSVVLIASLQKLGINIVPFLRSGPLRDVAAGKK